MADDTLFDCFLSHNSRDLEAARTLAAVLRDRKLRSWIDREELRPGEPWLDGLAQGLQACRSVAVLVGPQGPGPWQTEETRTALDLAVRGRLRAFAVLLPVKTVGVMGDQRTYHRVVVVRLVQSTDGMTANWYPAPPKLMARISTRIVNEVQGVNRVVYDVTTKPPGTIEWE